MPNAFFRLCFTILFAGIILPLNSQTYSRADVIAAIGQSVGYHIIGYSDDGIVIGRIDTIPGSPNPLSDFFKLRLRSLNYILNYFATFSHKLPDIDPDLSDAEIKEALRNDFVSDTVLVSLIAREAACFLNSKNAAAPDLICKKDTIKMDELLDRMVKFISISGTTPEGYFKTKICIGISDIVETEKIRLPHVEAFAFDVVFSHYDDSINGSREIMIDNAKKLYRLNLGVNPELRLNRAKGAYYAFLISDPRLRQLAASNYSEMKDALAFVIKDL